MLCAFKSKDIVNVICTKFSKLSFDIHVNCVVTLVWPPKGLRHLKVARGRKRLCTTGLQQQKQYIVADKEPHFWVTLLRWILNSFFLSSLVPGRSDLS